MAGGQGRALGSGSIPDVLLVSGFISPKTVSRYGLGTWLMAECFFYSFLVFDLIERMFYTDYTKQMTIIWEEFPDRMWYNVKKCRWEDIK